MISTKIVDRHAVRAYVKGTITADDVAVQAIRDKGLDPEADRKIRTDFGKRILTSLHDLHRKGRVQKIGLNRNVRWKLAGEA